MTVKGILEEERRGKKKLSHREQKRESGKRGRELIWPRLEEEGMGNNLVDGRLKRRDQERESEKEEGWLVLGE